MYEHQKTQAGEMDTACQGSVQSTLKRGNSKARLWSDLPIKAMEQLCGNFMFDAICSSLCCYLEDILELRKEERESN